MFSPTGLYAVWPSAGPPGSALSFFGTPIQVIIDDCVAASSASNCTGTALVGDYVCPGPLPDGALALDWPWKKQLDPNYYSWRVNCSLPMPAQSNGNATTAGASRW